MGLSRGDYGAMVEGAVRGYGRGGSGGLSGRGSEGVEWETRWHRMHGTCLPSIIIQLKGREGGSGGDYRGH